MSDLLKQDAQELALQAEVDALLAEFDGDPRAVIVALLHDLDILARDSASNVSRGYVRGRIVAIKFRA